MKEISVIPMPNKVEFKSNSEIIFPVAAYMENDFDENFSELLCEFFSSDSSKEQLESKICVKKIQGLEREEYLLEINDSNIQISASQCEGAFYAIQTLRQLLVNGKEDGYYKLPDCLIQDKPRFKYRGFMLDEARHFFGKDVVKRLLNVMASLKLNVFHWHLTDDQGWRIEIKKYPCLTEKGSVRRFTQLDVLNIKRDDSSYGKNLFYTQDEIKEIVEYAKKLNISIIPEIDLPGHLSAAIACLPELSCEKKQVDVETSWGVKNTIGCCGSDFLYDFSKDILDELCEIFPYKYIHIGGDEVPKKKWKTCSFCQKKIREKGLKDEKELQAYFTNFMNEYLKSKGKKLIAWNDILSASNVDDDITIQWWRKGCKKCGVEKRLIKKSCIIISKINYLYMDHCYSRRDLRKTYALSLSKLNLKSGFEKYILGIEGAMWTEYVRDEEKLSFNSFPRMQALSELCWTEEKNKNFEDFLKRIEKSSFIVTKNNFTSATSDFYLYSGLRGLFARIEEIICWLLNPNYEYERYIRKNKIK